MEEKELKTKSEEKVTKQDKAQAKQIKKIAKLSERVDKATTHSEHRDKAVAEYLKHLEEKGAIALEKQTWHQKHKLARLQRWAAKAKESLAHCKEELEAARKA